MPILDESHRAPARILKTDFSGALEAVLTWLLWPVIGCRHRNTTLPYNDRQTCLDCGASRLYLFHSDFEHADAGIFVGPWKRHTLISQDAHRVVASKLIKDAVSRRPLDGRSALLNPGSESSLFQRRDTKAVQR